MQRSPIEDKEAFETPPSPAPGAGAAPQEKPKLKKFHNGWNRQLENLVAEWADKASCYQWMHQKTEVRYQKYNYYFTIPVIIMSTLTGTANFATNSIVSTEEQAKLVVFGIGAISIIAGVISTVANFLRYAQGSEAHRVAAISWGKFQRFISIELALHPNERMDAMSFLKMGRIELDRLIEQSPPVPVKTIAEFTYEFREKKDIVWPEIAGGIQHPRIYDDRESRLAKVAAEAVYTIQQKKGLMRQLVMEDIDRRIVSRAQDERIAMEDQLRHEILTTAREVARDTAISTMKATPATTRPVVRTTPPSFPNPNPNPKSAQDVIPNGVVQKATQKIKRRLSIIGTATDRPMTVAEAAAAVGAIRTVQATPIQLQVDEADAIEKQTAGMYEKV